MKSVLKFLSVVLATLSSSSAFCKEHHVFLEEKLKENFVTYAQEVNKDAIKGLKLKGKALKKAAAYAKIFEFPYTLNSIDMLSENLADGDSILIHADGLPWIIGRPRGFNPDQDFTAHTLAQRLATILISFENIKVDLLICNSATDFQFPLPENQTESGNFAREFSDALRQLGAEDVVVYGYTGYIYDKGIMDYSVKAEEFGNVHSTLEDGRREFIDGTLTQEAKLVVIENYPVSKQDTNRNHFQYYLEKRADFHSAEDEESKRPARK